MSRTRNIGRAFPISEKEVRSYDAAARPRMRPNPMGVHTIATINGRGAYARSVRAAATGRTREQRMARARSVMRGNMKNSHRASFVSAMRSNRKRKGGKRRGRAAAGRRLGQYSRAYSKFRKAGYGKREAKARAKKLAFEGGRRRSAARRTPRRRKGGRRRRARKNFRRNRKGTNGIAALRKKHQEELRAATKSSRAAARAAKKQAKATKREAAKKLRELKKEKAKAIRAARAQKRAKSRRPRALRKVRRKYRRASIRDPRTGRTRKSYMYRDRKGRLRKIPMWVTAGAISAKELQQSKGDFDKSMGRIVAARQRAAKRILQGRDPFTPNKRRRRKGKRSAMARRKRRRSRKKGSRRRRKGRRKGRRSAGRRRRRGGRRSYWAAYRKARKMGYGKRKARSLAKRRAGSSRRRRKGGRRRRKGAKRRRKGGRRRRRARKNSSFGMNRRGSYTPNRRRRSRRRKKNRGYRSNKRRRNAFMADLKNVFKVGALVTTGFLIHRLLTSLANDYLFAMLVAPKNGEQTSGQATLSAWGKPIMGGVVAVAGYALAGAAFPKARVEIGAGMVASFLQSIVVSVLMTANQPKIAAQFEGVSGIGNVRYPSRAYQLRGGRGRRGMRGLGQGVTSLMPRYAPVGQFVQAAAGMGEYFTPNSVGEYFVPTEQLQGVGQYEPAGPLAMQAAAGMGQTIDDGIRPDADLDRVLTLAESAAGVGAARMRRRGRRGMRGVGEFYTATKSNSEWTDTTVPTQDQWIPSGPLWAGTLGVRDTQGESELPAGVLAGPGGNGILSG